MNGTPLYAQIVQYYGDRIDAEKLAEGDQMPTEEEIGGLFNVSRITVRKALDELSRRGYIQKVHGKGSFVTGRKMEMQLNHLIGFSEEMRLLGLTPSTQLLEQGIEPPGPKAAEALEMDPAQKVYTFTRLRCANAVPIAVERVSLPFHRFPGLENHDLTSSLYALLRERYGCERHWARQRIQAAAAGKRDAERLGVKPGFPVMLIDRVTHEPDGRPFEYVHSTYNSQRYVFNVTLTL